VSPAAFERRHRVLGFAAHAAPRSDPARLGAGNMEPVGYSAMENRLGAFKWRSEVNGRWYLYTSHLALRWSIRTPLTTRDPGYSEFVKGGPEST